MDKGIEQLALETAYEKAKQCDYMLGYTTDGIVAGRVCEQDINMDSFFEVRFFSEDKEIHIFDYNGEKRAIYTTDEYGEYVEKKFKMNEKYGTNRFLYVKEFIKYDTDGQLYIAKTVLKKIGE